MQTLPNRLFLRGRLLTHAGPGWSPGSATYADPARNGIVELYPARIVRSEGRHLVVAAEGNGALGQILVPREAWAGTQAPTVGDRVLAGPVSWSGSKAHAQAAWLLRPPPSRRTRARREHDDRTARPRTWRSGTLTEFHRDRNFGRLVDDQGHSVFVHGNDLTPGTRPVVGARYRFLVRPKARGPAAHDVRAA